MGLQQAKLVTRHLESEVPPEEQISDLFQIFNPSLANTLRHTKQKAIVSRHASTLTLALPLDRLILFTMSAKTTKRSILWRLFFASTSNILFLKQKSLGAVFLPAPPSREGFVSGRCGRRGMEPQHWADIRLEVYIRLWKPSGENRQKLLNGLMTLHFGLFGSTAGWFGEKRNVKSEEGCCYSSSLTPPPSTQSWRHL